MQRRWQILGFIYLMVFSLILWLAYHGQLPGFLTQNDKLAHMVLYGIATFIGHRIFKARVLWRSIPLFPFLFGVFTIVEEFSQSLSPNRTFDLGDLVASFIGIAIGWWLCERSKQ